MPANDDGTPIADVPDDPKKPEEPQRGAGASPSRNFGPSSAKARREEIFQRRRQNLDKLEARIVARSQPQNIPLHGQPNQPQEPVAANQANALPTPPAMPVEPAATTANKIDEVGGHHNTPMQADTIINFNVTETLAKDFIQGKLEGFFKSGASLGVQNEGEESGPDTVASSLPKAPTSIEGKFIKGIQSSSTGAAFVNKPGAGAKTSVKALPRNEKEIEHWYYQELSVRERCFVQAAAVLHGAPLRAISEATRELYAPLKAQDEAREETRKAQEKPQPSTPPPAAFHVPDVPPSSVSDFLVRIYSLIQQEERVRLTQSNTSEEVMASPLPVESPSESINTLLERTHTYTRRVNGATRLFWQDADESGLSRFSVDLLRFLAREASMEDMFGSQLDQRFLDIIGQWPTKYQGERSWRSASALGVIWWHQDARTFLWRQANKWAKSQQEQDWERAAALLDGAYQVERDTMQANAADGVSSSVLQLLNQWISTAHQAKTERGEGYAAARAYGLIGRKSPEIALKGLERLLRFPQLQATNEGPCYPPEDLFVFGVLKYVDLVRSGHIRQVLKHLADEAERYAHWQGVSQIKGEHRENANQRSVALFVIFTAFFLVVSCSLSAVDHMVSATYSTSEQLSAHPSCPDSEGRDILLAGLLTTAEQPYWQDQLATLLCALIMEKNYQPALYLLRRWGEIVLQYNSANSALEETYAQFLVKIGELIQTWSAHRGAAQHFAFGTYKYGLTLWLTDRRIPQPGFSQLAQKVLNRLPETN